MYFVAQVQASGGVLMEVDFSNYTTVLQQPVQSRYQGKHLSVFKLNNTSFFFILIVIIWFYLYVGLGWRLRAIVRVV